MADPATLAILIVAVVLLGMAKGGLAGAGALATPLAALADTISPGSEFVQIGNERKHVISYLEDFLFPPQRARSPVKSLSGGERNRLLLARLFANPANVLVLDEPTNDLDIETLELLESLLQEFEGTLFLVSHDRAFLENTVTQVIAFEGNGVLTEFGGGYDDWRRFT
ncbi:ATP-binding cassette domain-containing protein, partial [Sphingopyxis sp.]|uniref:ATP-binding cassette domain-containing protein n=1 Tax=Sphingopyxis sp. TaxID=1908224 RepID=UPI002D800A73